MSRQRTLDGLTLRQILHLEDTQDTTPRQLIERLEGMQKFLKKHWTYSFVCPTCQADTGKPCFKKREPNHAHAERTDLFCSFSNAVNAELMWVTDNVEKYGQCDECWQWDRHARTCSKVVGAA